MGDLPIVAMRNITKQFPGILANDHISFDLHKGEIHTLLGENGAGKTTLMNILSGLYAPDEGDILLEGEQVEFKSPREAFSYGIGMVHQHFMLIPSFTVLENVVLGMESTREPLLDLDESRQKLVSLSEKYHLITNPDKLVSSLSVGERQRVEILKVLYRNARILVLDEPTSVLTPQEVNDLFNILRALVESNCSIVFISHKLDEVLSISDRITVLRDGHVVDTVDANKTNKRELAQMMVGREVLFTLDKAEVSPGETILKAENIFVKDENENPILNNISFEVHRGEILGIAGVSGNGQTELAEALTGLRPVNSGYIEVCGDEVTNKPVKEFYNRGVSHIPEDRQVRGLFLGLPLWSSIIFTDVAKKPFSSNGILHSRPIREYSNNVLVKFDVRPQNEDALAKQLSGGNQQKVIVGRELTRTPRNLVIAVQPTRGLDVGATEYVQNTLLKERDNDAAVLLFSTELNEIIALADRIAVIYEGEIMGIIDAKNVDIENIGLMMAGTKKEEIEKTRKTTSEK